MKRLVGSLLATLVSAVMLLTLSVGTAWAHDDYGNATSEPALGVAPLPDEQPIPPEGAGSPQLRHYGCRSADDGSRTSSAISNATSSKCPDGWSWGSLHDHYVDDIYGRYDGFYYNEVGHACYGPCVLGLSSTITWSNAWNVSIGFDKGPVSAKVGFDVTDSGTRTYSVSFNVGRGQRKQIAYEDWYHVKKFNVHTFHWYPQVYNEGGRGWAADWYIRFYRAVNA